MTWSPFKAGPVANPGIVLELSEFAAVWDDEEVCAGFRWLFPALNIGWVDRDDAGIARRVRLDQYPTVQTVDDTPTEIYLSPDLTLEPGAVAYRVQVEAWGIHDDPAYTNEHAYYRRDALFTAIGGALTLQGAVAQVVTIEGVAAFDCIVQADGTNTKVQVQVKGHATLPMDWIALVSIIRHDGKLIA